MRLILCFLQASPLFTAVKNGHLRVVKSLIQAKANVNLVMTRGWTPLHYAAHGNHYRIGLRLFKAGANLLAKNSKNSILFFINQYKKRRMLSQMKKETTNLWMNY